MLHFRNYLFVSFAAATAVLGAGFISPGTPANLFFCGGVNNGNNVINLSDICNVSATVTPSSYIRVSNRGGKATNPTLNVYQSGHLRDARFTGADFNKALIEIEGVFSSTIDNLGGSIGTNVNSGLSIRSKNVRLGLTNNGSITGTIRNEGDFGELHIQKPQHYPQD